MPFVIINHHKIHYELHGDRGPFFFLHGPFLTTVNLWREAGYLEALENTFRVVAIEPLGQGRSDAPDTPASYTIDARVEHVLGVFREMQVDYAHFLGVGLGAQVGFQMSVTAPQRLRTLNTMGAHPYPLIDEMPLQQEGVLLLREGKLKAYLDKCRVEEGFAPEQLEQLQSGSLEAYAASLEGSIRWEGISEQLSELSTPTQLITATSEGRFLSVREAGRQMRYGRYTILPRVAYDHGLWSAELVLSPLLEYLRRQR